MNLVWGLGQSFPTRRPLPEKQPARKQLYNPYRRINLPAKRGLHTSHGSQQQSSSSSAGVRGVRVPSSSSRVHTTATESTQQASPHTVSANKIIKRKDLCLRADRLSYWLLWACTSRASSSPTLQRLLLFGEYFVFLLRPPLMVFASGLHFACLLLL